MKGKGYARTIAAGLAFVALLAYIFIAGEYGRVADKDELFGLNVEDATRLTVEGDTAKFSLVRRGEDWFIERPFEGLANTDEAERRVKTIAELKPVGSRDVDLQDEQFGLQTPRLTAVLEYGKGKEIRIAIGSGTPTGSEIFASVEGRDKLYILSASVLSTLDRDIEDLREKKLVRVDETDVRVISLAHGDQRLVVENRPVSGEDHWSLTAPISARADEFQTEQLVSKLVGLEARHFVGPTTDAVPAEPVAEEPGAEEAADADGDVAEAVDAAGEADAGDDAASEAPAAQVDYGFGAPSFAVELTTAKGEKISLTVGRQATPDELPEVARESEYDYLYAQVSGRNEIALVRADEVENLQKEPIDLRDKAIVDLKKDNISFIKVQAKDRLSFSLKRLPDGWHLDTPVKAVANAMKADDLLWDISQLEAREYVDENPEDLKQYGLAIPDIVIEVHQLGGAPVKIKIGYEHGEDTRYAQTSEGNQVYAISDMLINDLPVTLEDIQSVD